MNFSARFPISAIINQKCKCMFFNQGVADEFLTPNASNLLLQAPFNSYLFNNINQI